MLTHVLLPLLCQPADAVGSVQYEVVTRLVKQGALGGGGKGEDEHLGALLRGLCGVQLLRMLPEDDKGGGRHMCEWTDLTLPVLTAILAQRPTLSDETVLCLLERMQGALEVSKRARELGTLPTSSLVHVFSLTPTHPPTHPHPSTVQGGGGLGHSFKFAALVNAFVGKYAAQVCSFAPVLRKVVAACEEGEGGGGGSGSAAALVRTTLRKALSSSTSSSGTI